ncbi:MAG: 30S ribosomal protein S17 [Nanoarchaeota archaeon]|nr:30S ribosomal protein S17 [Nanoarchaeota archaeon]
MARDIGIQGIKPPKDKCTDKKCPFHGNLKVRGRTFQGTVASTKMNKSAVITWSRVVKIPKYERYMRKKTRVTAHVSPCMQIKEGDKVLIGETRPISKTKKFVVLQKQE